MSITEKCKMLNTGISGDDLLSKIIEIREIIENGITTKTSILLVNEFLRPLLQKIIIKKWLYLKSNNRIQQYLRPILMRKEFHPLAYFLLICERLSDHYEDNSTTKAYKLLFVEIIENLLFSQDSLLFILKKISEIDSNHENWNNNEFPSIELIIKSLFNLPEKLSNYLSYCPTQFNNVNYYSHLTRSFCIYIMKFGTILEGNENNSGRMMLEQLITYFSLHGKYDYFIQEIIQFVQEKEERVLIFEYIGKIIQEINLYGNYLLYLLKYMNSTIISSENSVTYLLLVSAHISENEINFLTRSKIIHHKFFKAKVANLIVIFLTKKSFTSTIEAFAEESLQFWAELNFVKLCPISQEKYVTFLIVKLMPECPRNFFKSEINLIKIREGIQYRLDSINKKDYGMILWNQFCSMIKLEDTGKIMSLETFEKFMNSAEEEEQAEILALQKRELLSEKLANKSKKEQSVLQEEEKKVNCPKISTNFEFTEDDSDNESDFEGYEIDEDYSDLKKQKPPEFLYDCLLGLDSDNQERCANCLSSAEILIRGNLDDLELICIDLANKLLRISNTYSIEQFNEQKEGALVALLTTNPLMIIKVLCQRFYNNEVSIGEKYSILDVIQKGSFELTGGNINHKDSEILEPKEVGERIGKTRIWGKRKLELLKSGGQKGKVNEYHKYSNEFIHGLCYRINDPTMNYQLFSTEAENLLNKLLYTLANLLQYGSLGVEASTQLEGICGIIEYLIPRESTMLHINLIYILGTFPQIMSSTLLPSFPKLLKYAELFLEWMLHLSKESSSTDCRVVASFTAMQFIELLKPIALPPLS